MGSFKNSTNSNSDNSEYTLYSISNYRPKIENHIQDILTRFSRVIVDYMRYIAEKITMKNKPYYRFIFERGVETIIHVFSVIFYYTKNLDLTVYHSQKAYYFYIEFIEQISDNDMDFLKLSSRDAILFVYKKTIYDLNNEQRKNMPAPTHEEVMTLEYLDAYKYIYKNIVQFLINHKEFKYETKLDYINTNCDCIDFISELFKKSKIRKNNIDCVYLFTTILLDKNISTNEFFSSIEIFIKKVNSKKKIDDKKLKDKLYDIEINSFVAENQLNKMIEWIFMD